MRMIRLIAVAWAWASPAAVAHDGTIAFAGAVTAQTCVVEPISNGAHDGNNFTVELRNVHASSLNAAGKRGAAIPFQLVVGSATQPCPYRTVRGTFRSTGDTNAAGRLTNQGTARNVDVVMMNANYQDIDLNTGGNTMAAQIDPVLGVGVIYWHASYHATAAVTPGTVFSQVEYVLTYE